MTCNLQAELRKEQNLKYMGLPWVFVQPTRLKSVKIPHSKNNNKQKTFNDGDDGLFSFLGNTDIPFSEEEIQLMKRSMQKHNKDGTLNTNIPNESSTNFLLNSNELLEPKSKSKSEAETPKEKPYQEPEIDHDEIYSAREINLDFDDLNTSNSAHISPSPSSQTLITIEPASMKSMIEDALVTQETMEEQFAGKVKLSNFSMNTEETPKSFRERDPNEPPKSNRSKEMSDAPKSQREKENNEKNPNNDKQSAQDHPKAGRKRLLQAIKAAQLSSDSNEFTFSQALQEDKDKVQKQFSESLGAQLFKQYLEKKNEKIPAPLMNI